jgi:hypothetical protein
MINNTRYLKKIFILFLLFITFFVFSNIYSYNSYEKSPEEPYIINYFELDDFEGFKHNYTELTGFITNHYNVLIVPFTLNDKMLDKKVDTMKFLYNNLKDYNIRFLMVIKGRESSRNARDFIQKNNINFNVWYDRNSILYSNLTNSGKVDGNSIFYMAKDRKIHYYYPFDKITDKNDLSQTLIKRTKELNNMTFEREKIGDNKVDFLLMGNSSGDFSVCSCPSQPYGGLARYAYLLDEYRREYEEPPVAILVGNILDEYTKPDYHDFYLKGISELKMSALIPAISDFCESPQFLKRYLDIVPYTSININKLQLPFSPYEVVNTNGLSIGILGLTPQEAVEENMHLPYDFLIDDYNNKLQKNIQEIKDITDIIILSGHFKDNREVERLMSPHPDIDFVINSNSNRVSIISSAIHRYEVPIIELGNKGEFVLRVTIQLTNDKAKAVDIENILLDNKVKEHGELLNYYYAYQETLDMY